MKSEDLVKQFYSESVHSEWRRLVKNPYHRLELNTTLHFLEKYLPAQGLILDAGGGPGRYTLELAQRGYQMVLLDATQANLDFARRMVRRYGIQDRVKEIACGSIVDLSRYAENTFDAVICTGGPLSHVLDPAGRQQAISELVRVVKPGSPLFVSVIGRLAVLVVILIESQVELDMPHFELLRESGDYHGERGFTACHFYLPEELLGEFSRPDLAILELAGLEGISTQHIREFNRLARDEKRFSSWLQTHYRTCTHPGGVAMSEHMLIISRKQK
ncbi:MAG: class I SAM-dependent methyltransferase [Anaerolineales bacterium]|nr:MAG: class I SAM-dependent methyltransferase [Anaerolineales bacterium]